MAPHDEAHPPPRGDRQGPVATFPQVHHTTALLVLVAVEVLTSEVGQLGPSFPPVKTSDHLVVDPSLMLQMLYLISGLNPI